MKKDVKSSVSLIIPCYNEEKNLKILYKDFKKLSKKKNLNLELILVDNGSKDKSFFFLNKFKNLKNQNFIIKVLQIKKNIGYGNGIMKGVMSAKNEIIAWTHADLQTDINDIAKGINLYKKLQHKYKKAKILVKGKRYRRNFLDFIFTYFMSLYIFILSGKYLDDINAQPKIFNRILIKDLKNSPKDFLLDFYLLFKAKNNKYITKDFGVLYKNRKHGIAKGGGSLIGKINLSIKSIKYILKFFYGSNYSQS